eukprot:TRINITY_DN6991_c0_g1_i1.p1 TRINITY_DN6991_c0_g1~~TRINITY_DN6991_c0_g1_i1.p1  ORF type:complete len:359 (+),score=85.26 TRINITY_DN6991_c0_g1_i1:30-1079(+)
MDATLGKAVAKLLGSMSIRQAWVRWSHDGEDIDPTAPLHTTRLSGGDTVRGVMDASARALDILSRRIPDWRQEMAYRKYQEVLFTLRHSPRDAANQELQDLLVDTGLVGDPLHSAVRNSSIEDCQRWLQCGYDVNSTNRSGYTPLMVVCSQFQCREDRASLVAFLLENGADVHSENTFGNTALHLACRLSDSAGIVELLLASNSNPNLQNKLGETPLHVACEHWHSAGLITSLLQHHADPNLTTRRGNTCLHYLMEVGSGARTHQLDLLLEGGVQVNACNDCGDTALDVLLSSPTAAKGFESLLREHGARTNRSHGVGFSRLGGQLKANRSMICLVSTVLAVVLFVILR